MKALFILCVLCSLAHAQPGTPSSEAPAAPLEVVVETPAAQPIVIVIVPRAAGGAAAPSAAPPGSATAAGAAPGQTPRRRARRPPAQEPLQDHTATIGVNPLGWVAGFYGLSASLALSGHTALRADATYVRIHDHYESYELELGLPIYPLRRFRGPFIEPGLAVRQSRGGIFVDSLVDPPPGYSELPAEHLRGANLLFGWHWMSDNGVNLAIAAGFALLYEAADDDFDPTPNGYVRLGYAF